MWENVYNYNEYHFLTNRSQHVRNSYHYVTNSPEFKIDGGGGSKGWWGDGAPSHCFTCSALEISSPTLLLSRNNGGLKSPLIKNITDRSQI